MNRFLAFLATGSIFVIYQIEAVPCTWPDKSDHSTLRQLITVFRHGERTPATVYPTDPYKADHWKIGLGELTNRGKLRHHKLGVWFRNCYFAFLHETFNVKDVYVRSTDVDRTLMSAEAHLSGMYPPLGDQVWDADIKWQPIPVHTVPLEEDYLLRNFDLCPRFREMEQESLRTDPRAVHMVKNHGPFIEMLKEKSGYTTIRDLLVQLADTLFVEYTQFNLTLPAWITPAQFNMLEGWRSVGFDMTFNKEKAARLAGGVHLVDLLSNMELMTSEATRNKTKPQLIYSAHDTTVASILSALNIFNHLAPPYAGTVILELHEVPKDTWVVKLFYQNETLHLPGNESIPAPYPFNTPGCPDPCTLTQLKKATHSRQLQLKDREAACKSSSDSGLINRTTLIISSITLAALVVTVLALTTFLRCADRHMAPGEDADVSCRWSRCCLPQVRINTHDDSADPML